MPTVKLIESKLFEFAPPQGAMDWDNVGLLVGDPNTEVSRVLVALDITEAVVDEAIEFGAQLIVAHHPVMNCKWLPVQTVRQDTPQGHLLIKMLNAKLSAICMHTNLDVAKGGVNDALAGALKLIDPGPLGDDGIGRTGSLLAPVSLIEFLSQVYDALQPNGMRYVDAGRPVSRVAVGGGSCSDYIDAAISAGCDTFVTADISYHTFLDTASMNLNLIDAGHFPTENVVCPVLIRVLKQAFPKLLIKHATSHQEVIRYYNKGE